MQKEHRQTSPSVLVEPLEPSYCEWCNMDGRRCLCTHKVVVTHWYTWRGATSTFIACEFHAAQICRELKRQVNGVFREVATT